MPEGYIAVCHVVSNIIKKTPLRLSSCWTPVSGSFESIVEEDEELNDEEDLETAETQVNKTGALFGRYSQPAYSLCEILKWVLTFEPANEILNCDS